VNHTETMGNSSASVNNSLIRGKEAQKEHILSYCRASLRCCADLRVVHEAQYFLVALSLARAACMQYVVAGSADRAQR
jgi:hypothetical protein